ncbi:MAG TPA: acyltransferase, partial [Marinagarivorans sp.]
MKTPARSSSSPANTRADHMPALTGIRFFAILHIFLYHLWSLYNLELDPPFTHLMQSIEKLPELAIRYCSHGWMSTSFFFLLSGFILSYLYWRPDGNLSTSRRTFWINRFTRIYPIHLIILIPTGLIMASNYAFDSLAAVANFAGALIATATLTQAWYPPWVPSFSWPTWTLSALIFLYLVTPLSMRILRRLSRRGMFIALAILPVLSLIPTLASVFWVENPHGFSQNESVFIGSLPLFWLPHFVAGLLLARAFGIQRGESAWRPQKTRHFAWGDVALLAVIAIALMPDISNEPLRYFIRHGLLMPLYMVITLDLARHHGVAARLFSLPGTGFLGNTGFSIFVWQNLVMAGCWIALMINPDAWAYQLEIATLAVIFIGI